MKNLFSIVNGGKWYIAAGLLLIIAIGYTYGLSSKCPSLLDPNKKISRAQLQNELNYVIGQAKCYADDLDKQDAVKQALLDAANIIGSSGTINPSGLLNLAASVGGISFGLTQMQKRKAAEKTA